MEEKLTAYSTGSRSEYPSRATIIDWYNDGTLPQRWRVIQDLVARNQHLDSGVALHLLDCAISLSDEPVLAKALGLLSQSSILSRPMFSYAKADLGIEKIDRLFRIYQERFAGDPRVGRYLASLIAVSNLHQECCGYMVSLQRALPSDLAISRLTIRLLSRAGREQEALPILEQLRGMGQLDKAGWIMLDRIMMGTGEQEEAEKMFEQAVATHTADKIAFVHIRKTAGSTLLDAISHNYLAHQQLRLDGRPSKRDAVSKSLTGLEKKPISFIYGHVGFGITKFLPPHFNIITILRNPVERVLSQYYFLRANRTSPESYYQKHSLEYAFSDPEVNHLFTNVQTRVLSSEEVQVSQKSSAEMGQQDLRAALENLERFALVGFTEQFGRMLNELTRRFGLRIANFTNQKENLTKPSWAEIPSSTRELIVRANELDEELYDVARKQSRLI